VKKKSKKTLHDPITYLAEIKGGFVAVAEGVGDKEIKNEQAVRKIKRLLEARKKAHRELGKIIKGQGMATASIHNVHVLGEGD
jgi:hypothetical protein